MCIYNKSIYTTSRLLYPSNYPILKHLIKCGYCYECLEDTSKEILLRGYYEGLNTFRKNGCVIFDTLTYSDKFVPKVNEVIGTNFKDNFFVFRDKDVTDFLKLLRIRLSRIYNENATLKFLITGEYGTSEGHTHRPHYHCIFYYTGKLNPIVFSYLISDCWKYGRTDGIKYKGKPYFTNKRCFSNNNVYSLNITKYVIKYIEKECKYSEILRQRTNRVIKDRLGNFYNELDYFEKLEAQKLRNKIKQYRRLSNNFGEYGLNFFNDEEFFKSNMMMSYPDTKNVVNFVQMPTYYKRRLFYNLIYYTFDNEILSKWVLNERGRIFYIKCFYFRLKNTYNSLYNSYLNFNDKESILNILKDNTLEDVAKYITYKRFRLNFVNTKQTIDNLFNYESKPIKSYNTPKLRCIYKDSYINDKNKRITDLNLYINEDYEKVINILHNNSLINNKLRHNNYIHLRELKNKFKFYGIK